MKKIYVMAAFLGATTFAFNQAIQKAPVGITKSTEKAISSNDGTVKAPGVSLWTSDFSDQSEWQIGGNGNQGTWVIGDLTDLQEPTYYQEIASTTVGNGFAFFEGIPFLLSQNVDVQNAWIEMTGDVDCTGENRVTFKFEQSYRAFNHDKTYVEVSLDGGASWGQSTDINPDVAVNTSSTETVVYRNFTVNGSSQVRFRFRWENTNDDNNYGSGYAWQVDDVDVMTLADHDISTASLKYGSGYLHYYQIPESQVSAIGAGVKLTNEGLADQTNVKFHAEEVLQGNYTGSSDPYTIVAGTSDSVAIVNEFTPSGQGTYRLEYSVTADDADDVPSNNIMKPYPFRVGQNIYARDSSTVAKMGVVYGQMSGSNLDIPEPVEPGNEYILAADDELHGIDVQLGDKVVVGSEIFGVVYDGNLDQIPNGETAPYIVQPGDENSYITLKFSSPVSLTAGQSYVATARSYENDFTVASAGASDPQTSFVYYHNEGQWYYTTSTPVVRMNFDETLSIEDNEMSNLNVSQNYPNPFANETTVKFNLKEAQDVSYTVVDLTGKVLTNVNEGTTLAGDHEITIDGSSFANGVYYLNIKAGESTVTRKMIVNK